jgi:hypothetical protein
MWLSCASGLDPRSCYLQFYEQSTVTLHQDQKNGSLLCGIFCVPYRDSLQDELLV